MWYRTTFEAGARSISIPDVTGFPILACSSGLHFCGWLWPRQTSLVPSCALPCLQAIDAARSAIELPATNMYGADDGLPELRTAIKSKLATQNKLVASDVMVTAGANQAR
eukprot:4416122-Pleurochrysis_carterae.AAC.2